MDKDLSLHENMDMPDPNFPVKMHANLYFKKGQEAFSVHWHEENEFIYVTNGSGIIECNLKPLHVSAGDFIVVNSNDLHRGLSLSDDFRYYCIIMDSSMLQSKTIDTCETKYLIPIMQNRILFSNLVSEDKDIEACLKHFIKEYINKEMGYELELKGTLYRILALLLRRHVKSILTEDESNVRTKNLERFNPVLKYIEANYNEMLSHDKVSAMANMSRFHFCRLFKELTGKTLNEYINSIRINKAVELIKNSELSITEIALSTGFNDLNYFCRMFKRLQKISPGKLRI